MDCAWVDHRLGPRGLHEFSGVFIGGNCRPSQIASRANGDQELDKGGAICIERFADSCSYVGLGAGMHSCRIWVTTCFGDLAQTNLRGRCWLASDRFVAAIVEYKVLEIARTKRAAGGQRPHGHEGSSVPIYATNLWARPPSATRERDLGGVPHPPYG